MPSNQYVIERARHIEQCRRLLATVPCVSVVGARRIGKTTLAAQIADSLAGPVQRFDLELPSDLGRLAEPALALQGLDGLVRLDEVQRRPDLFPVLRSLIDRHAGGRFLVLGSAAPELLRQSSETLAGRVAFHDLTPFTIDEAESPSQDGLGARRVSTVVHGGLIPDPSCRH